MNQNRLFLDYSSFLQKYFEGKVQKLSVDAGLGCPNRDGTIGKGGCAYCNNLTFTPPYCHPNDSVVKQLEQGKAFFAKKYPLMNYLAYFQSHTNTYGPLDTLKRIYEEALSVDGVVGLVIGTRPDCVSVELLDYLSRLAERTFVLLEYGIESTDDAMLRRLNRGHSFAQAERAIRQTAERNIHTAGHVILGLPGETRQTMLLQPALLSALPLEILKLHQLQIVKYTTFEKMYAETPELFDGLFQTPEEYAELLTEYIPRLRPDLVLERFTAQSPADLLIAPKWGMKNYEFVELLKRKLQDRNMWQGKLFGQLC